MGIQYRQYDSKTSGWADASTREPSVRSRAGRTLRHWTADHPAFIGNTTTSASGAGDWGLADGRQRNLLASRLKSLAGRLGAL